MSAGKTPLIIKFWEVPVYVRVGSGFPEAIDGPEEALEYLDNRWPSTRGPAYEQAKAACQLVLDEYGSLHDSREMFIMAAIEASMLD